ncbi:DUF6907 domain-containing protein [Streptomyces sp. NRRL F-5123]|uniref:DUF6907 domain-containing protein n=1 Tax=Streptomyces sp. NRRL F-5123 TaxID=1463856 RepID=UPI00131EBFF4|nr:hypothetical protein [Streptomyces sp. NRRL F-5123]
MPEGTLTPQTVTIPTCDHGVVTIPEPEWCTGELHQPGGYRVDITHSSADDEFTVPIPRGAAVLLRTCLQQYPFAERSPGLEPFLSVELDGRWCPVEPNELRDLADALAGLADRLRSVSDRFNELTGAADSTPQALYPG